MAIIPAVNPSVPVINPDRLAANRLRHLAIASLRGNDSLNSRLKRYNAIIDLARVLESTSRNGSAA